MQADYEATRLEEASAVQVGLCGLATLKSPILDERLQQTAPSCTAESPRGIIPPT
jgi:hypothetical protein